MRECVADFFEEIERPGRRRGRGRGDGNADSDSGEFATAHLPHSAPGVSTFNHLCGATLPLACASGLFIFCSAMTQQTTSSAQTAAASPDVIVRGDASGFLQHVTSGKHQFEVDEPSSLGGSDRAPTPYDYLLAALGSCTSMTVALYARGKKWPLQHVTVSLWHSRIHARDCADCETKQGMLDRIDMQIELNGDLDQTQRAKLMEIAGKCPVHRTLNSEIDVRKRAVDSTASS